MSLRTITALFRCDGCEGKIPVDLDPADDIAEGSTSLFDVAEDYLRGGTTSDAGLCSIQDGMHLCGTCTAVADSIGGEAHHPTRAEINAALDKAVRA